ncbi:MAG: type II toxin-antitoxin system Phd/YefM family antitoxin [Paracoccaceae bacterium]
MKSINIHEAKTHLSRLVAAAARGESFIIAKAGKPMVQVTAIRTEAETAEARRHWMGAMQGRAVIPDDFDHFADDEIAGMFDLKS